MIGLVLAAGPGSRLGPLTTQTPKALLPVDDQRTILDVTLSNLSRVGIDRVMIVTGFAAERFTERGAQLSARHGVALEFIHNPKAEIWNNAYSLWCARGAFADGALLVNGDTLHPAGVEATLLEAPPADVVLALDATKALGEEEMKVSLSAGGQLQRISKRIPASEADGEYIGLALIRREAAGALADALQATWERDPSLYYEDGFQALADQGARVVAAPIGDVAWVEVDDADDLRRARDLASSPAGAPPP